MAQPHKGAKDASAPFGTDAYRGEKIGKYEVLSLLTLGGMAELFLAFTSGPGGFRKYVVVKRILPGARSNDEFVKMFLDEARVTAAFNHPNIAQVFDLGEEEDGLYLAMEFIAGHNLNQIATTCVRRKAQIPVGFSCRIAYDVCQALQYAHTFTDPQGQSAPVIHRDVAQKNVMVAYDGSVKLLDFGIAKARGKLGQTGAGMVKGTTGYMSPEQVRGEQVDGRTDVFSTGVMLYEMLTCRRLFSGQTELEEMKKILDAPIPAPILDAPMIPEAISDVVVRALDRDRSGRFQSARDFARALQSAAGTLMFDRDQMSGFMSEFFSAQIKATRALLESAGASGDSPIVKAALAALREDASVGFPDRPPRQVRADPTKPQRTYDPEASTEDLSLRQLQEQIKSRAGATGLSSAPPRSAPPPAKVAVAEQPPAVETRFIGWMPILLGIALLGLGFAAYRALTDFGDEPVILAPGAPPPPWSQANAPVPQPDPKPAPPAPAPAPASNRAGGSPEAPPEPPKPHPAAQGKMTLFTTPDSEVFDGGRSLGKTPLFNVSLKVGTHLLRLKGADGVTHLLSVPVAAGKPAKFRFALKDLPSER